MDKKNQKTHEGKMSEGVDAILSLLIWFIFIVSLMIAFKLVFL